MVPAITTGRSAAAISSNGNDTSGDATAGNAEGRSTRSSRTGAGVSVSASAAMSANVGPSVDNPACPLLTPDASAAWSMRLCAFVVFGP